MFPSSRNPQQPQRLEGRSSAPAWHPKSATPNPELGGELVLIRGLPGSGKSTMAAEMAAAGFAHFEADQFFTVDGVYNYDASRIRKAHEWCQQMTRQALMQGQRVVVSNTFTRLQEMEPYRAMTNNVRVVEAHGRWENTHGVSAETLQRMSLRWERLPC